MALNYFSIKEKSCIYFFFRMNKCRLFPNASNVVVRNVIQLHVQFAYPRSYALTYTWLTAP